MSRKERIILLLLGICSVSHLTSCALLPKEEEFSMAPIIQEYEGAEYSKVNVKAGDVVEAEEIRGTYSSSNQEELYFYEDEMEVYKVYVKQGDKVKKGDVIAELKTEDLDEEIEKKEFEIKKNKLSQRQAIEIRDLEIEKQRKVYNDAKAIQAIRDQCEAELSNLKNDLKLLNLYRDDLLEQKEGYSLIAGINGNVTFLAENLEGSMSDSSEAVCIIADNAKPRFIAETERAADFADGDKVSVKVDEELEVLTEVSHPKKRKKIVYFDLLEKPEGLQDGDKGVVEFVIKESRDVLYLPKAAVKTMGDKHVVYYEDENGLKVAKEVVVGLTAQGKTEIVSGLELGEEIIVK